MAKIKIATDSTADIPKSFCEELNISILPLTGPMRLGRRYAADVMDMDAFQNITGYTGKVLLLHGDRDTIVDMEYSKRAFAVYQAAGADARFVTIPGGKHIFRRSAHIRQAQKTIAGFAENIKEDNYEIDNSLV